MAAKSSTCESNYCRYLPFFNLSDAEFNAVICNWSYDFGPDLDLFNILPNPDKFDDKDPDNMLNCPHSYYYSLDQLNQLFDSTTSKCLSMFHCSIRSLPKNLSLLSEFLHSVNRKPDILAVTETRLSTRTVTNVDIFDIYILGDFNIDLLKYSEHLLSEEYLNMLY